MTKIYFIPFTGLVYGNDVAGFPCNNNITNNNNNNNILYIIVHM